MQCSRILTKSNPGELLPHRLDFFIYIPQSFAAGLHYLASPGHNHITHPLVSSTSSELVENVYRWFANT